MPTIIKTHMIVQRHLIINWEEFCAENKLEEGRGARHLLTWGVQGRLLWTGAI